MSVWTGAVQVILVSPVSQPYKCRLGAHTLFPEVKPESTAAFSCHRHTERAHFRPENLHFCPEDLREK